MINFATMNDILIEGFSVMTIHHPCKKQTEECASEEISAYKKRQTVMRFSLTMVREEDPETGGNQETPHPKAEWEDQDIEDNCFCDEDLLLESIDDDHGSDPDSPSCHNCDEKAEIAQNFALIGRLYKELYEENNLFMKSHKGKYVAPFCKQICVEDTMSATITIYHITKDFNKSKVSVVLNFTGTDNFFSCTTQGEKKILTLTRFDKNKLHSISPDDTEKSCLVFYMSRSPSSLRRFESALYRGWFIQNVDSDNVKMQRCNSETGNDSIHTFFSVIKS
ncbi:uncharacterized protein LOC127626210 [Xyrauchen texanus]|uniref:uncharacterized protein LOC127626210 n=1 Tax=Xyrauchen texanus TaxID=154827 RepID=UPI0022426096|nr:uncharacterized protein LOC127626210 [Xyrauchen texanus]